MSAPVDSFNDNARWRDLAGNALWEAVALNGELAAQNANAISEEFGADAVVQAALGWIDTSLHYAGIDEQRTAALAFLDADGDGTLRTADEVPADVAWAGRVINARINGDEPTFTALFLAFATDEDYSMALQRLLGCCALMIRERVML